MDESRNTHISISVFCNGLFMFRLTRLRPAAPALAAGPLVSEAALVLVLVVLLLSSLGGLPATPEPEPCEDMLELRGL